MTSSIRMVAVELTLEDLEREARAEGLCLPIEQTAAWARYEATVDGRSPWAHSGSCATATPSRT